MDSQEEKKLLKERIAKLEEQLKGTDIKKQKLYVALDVGCIECGESSAVLGIFTDSDEAKQVCDEHYDRQLKEWGGEHSFEVHVVEGIDLENRVEY